MGEYFEEGDKKGVVPTADIASTSGDLRIGSMSVPNGVQSLMLVHRFTHAMVVNKLSQTDRSMINKLFEIDHFRLRFARDRIGWKCDVEPSFERSAQ